MIIVKPLLTMRPGILCQQTLFIIVQAVHVAHKSQTYTAMRYAAPVALTDQTLSGISSSGWLS